MGKKKKIETRVLPASFQVEERESGRVITGYSAVFDKDSEFMGFTERISPGAFKNALKKSDVRGLFNHNPDYVLGREASGTLRLKEDDKGLHMEIDPPDSQVVRDLVMTPIARGDIDEQSFSFIVKSDQWDGMETDNPTRTILDIQEIRDVGPVTFGAYQDTDVALRSLDMAKQETNEDDSTVPDETRTEDTDQIVIKFDTDEYIFRDGEHLKRVAEHLLLLGKTLASPTADEDGEPSPTTSGENRTDDILEAMRNVEKKYGAKEGD